MSEKQDVQVDNNNEEFLIDENFTQTDYYIMSYEDFVLEFGFVPGVKGDYNADFDNPMLATTPYFRTIVVNETTFYIDIMIGAPTPFIGIKWLQDYTVWLHNNISGNFTVTTTRLYGADMNVIEVNNISSSSSCYMIGEIQKQNNHRKVQVGNSALYRFIFITDEAYSETPTVDVVYSFTLVD